MEDDCDVLYCGDIPLFSECPCVPLYRKQQHQGFYMEAFEFEKFYPSVSHMQTIHLLRKRWDSKALFLHSASLFL